VSTAYETRCIGTARLCDDDGMVINPVPAYPDGYHCSGVSFVGTGIYVRCDNPRHSAWTVPLSVMSFVPLNVAAGAVGTNVQYVIPNTPSTTAIEAAGYCPHCGRSS